MYLILSSFATTAIFWWSKVRIRGTCSGFELTRTDNPVNQQIAIRFIKSLGFPVSAVWNGKEALEYLLRATSPQISPEEAEGYPIPALILMDVQMPVLDGYNATHLLRHHHPYATIEAIRQIPIVAMTASAIRGDKERCEKAGMDDYMAKPVKRVMLEKMLLKWIRRRQQSRRPSLATSDGGRPVLTRSGTDHSSNCPEHDYIAADFLNARAAAMAALTSQAKEPRRPSLGARRPSLSQNRRYSRSKNLMVQDVTGETENERSLRREEAEEQARSSRDAKLISATDDEHGMPVDLRNHEIANTAALNMVGKPLPDTYPSHGTDKGENSVMALTQENVEKFNSTVENQSAAAGGGANGVALKKPSPVAAAVVPAADIPGPPPNLKPPVSVLDSTSVQERPGALLSVGHGKRPALGAFRTGERSRSDWSNSTARPVARRGSSSEK
jgi:CheY-like chemotaxis protein